jgi:hypothetical protein
MKYEVDFMTTTYKSFIKPEQKSACFTQELLTEQHNRLKILSQTYLSTKYSYSQQNIHRFRPSLYELYSF